MSVRLAASSVVLGQRLSSSHSPAEEYANMLESFEVFCPAWSPAPLTLLVFNPQGKFTTSSSQQSGSAEEEPSTLGLEAFMRLSVQWLQCSQHHHHHHRLQQHQQHDHQWHGHVREAYFLRFIKQCWCVVIAPVPESNLQRAAMQLEYTQLKTKSQEEERERHRVTMSLEDFLTQGKPYASQPQ